MNIVLLTKNKFKTKELKSILSGYGFKITICNEYDLKNKTNIQIVEELGLDEVVLLREKTKLLQYEDENKFAELNHLERVLHVSEINAYFYKNGKTYKSEHCASVEGFIDLTKRNNVNSDSIYNWDDIFVSTKTFKTYYEMQDYQNKLSARNLAMSSFIKEVSIFKNKVDLNFNPINQDSVISFNGEVYDLILNNNIISKFSNNIFLNNIMTHVFKNGLFTRSAINKKQRNYWYPSLNAGLPLVPKKDEVHELTFMFHDIMHHAMPDLILTGEENALYRETYIIHRMMSEAFSLVLADMMFIDELSNSGIDYDWTKRKIYPVYKSMMVNELDEKTLKNIIWANVKFALLGDDSILYEMSDKKSVSNYVKKYEKFFIEDYRWTEHNFKNMMSNKSAIKSWYQKNKDLMNQNNVIDTYSELITEEMSFDVKVNNIFEKCWNNLSYMINNPVDFNLAESTSNAFKNYMIGQSIVFDKYDYFHDSKYAFELIHAELKDKVQLSILNINKVRSFYQMYLNKMVSQNIISEHEALTYNDIVPLFDSFYVFYDKKLEYNSIKDITQKLFKNEVVSEK